MNQYPLPFSVKIGVRNSAVLPLPFVRKLGQPPVGLPEQVALNVIAVGIASIPFPSGTNVSNFDRIIQARTIWNEYPVGNHEIINGSAGLFAKSVPFETRFGEPLVSLFVRTVQAGGWLDSWVAITQARDIEPHKIFNRNQFLSVKGRRHSAFNKHDAGISFNGSFDAESTNDALATITHEVRGIVTKGWLSDGYGSPMQYRYYEQGERVSHKVREVSVSDKGIPAPIFYDSHIVSPPRIIYPEGYEATLWLERIIPSIQRVYPEPLVTLYGLPTIELKKRHLEAASIAYDWMLFVGQHKVYNKTQYILIEVDEDSDLAVPKQEGWTAIQNRNREIHAYSIDSLKHGYALVKAGAERIEPVGIFSEAIGKQMISDRVRHINLEGIDIPYMNEWHVVYNGAMVIGNKGYNSAIFGEHLVENTRRYFPYIGAINSLVVGSHTVSFGTRYLVCNDFYSIKPPTIPLPTVHNYMQYVDAVGRDVSGIGQHYLDIRFNIIRTRWDKYGDNIGNAHLKNVTPEILVRGSLYEEFGKAFVRLQFRHFDISPMSDMQEFGRGVVTFKVRTIQFAGAYQYSRFGWHKLELGRSPPFSLQRVYVESVRGTSEVGFHTLNSRVIYHYQSIPFSRIGDHTVTANSIQIQSGINDSGLGEPVFSGYALVIKQTNADIGEDGEPALFGKPRLSPHTIWVTTDTPEQAVINHDRKAFSYDNLLVNWSWNDRHSAENKNRPPIVQKWYAGETLWDFGFHTVTLKTQFIKPNSLYQRRFGLPVILFTTQDIEQIKSNDFASIPTTHRVKFPDEVNMNIGSTGYDASLFGLHDVQNQHREIYPASFDSERMGSSVYNDKPFMWQGLRVGELVKSNIGAGDQSFVDDNTWVSHRIREVQVIGIEHQEISYELSSFRQRMRVTRMKPDIYIPPTTPAPRPPDSVIGEAVGIYPPDMPPPDIRNKVHYIRPTGNSEQYRKGAF